MGWTIHAEEEAMDEAQQLKVKHIREALNRIRATLGDPRSDDRDYWGCALCRNGVRYPSREAVLEHADIVHGRPTNP